MIGSQAASVALVPSPPISARMCSMLCMPASAASLRRDVGRHVPADMQTSSYASAITARNAGHRQQRVGLDEVHVFASGRPQQLARRPRSRSPSTPMGRQAADRPGWDPRPRAVGDAGAVGDTGASCVQHLDRAAHVAYAGHALSQHEGQHRRGDDGIPSASRACPTPGDEVAAGSTSIRTVPVGVYVHSASSGPTRSMRSPRTSTARSRRIRPRERPPPTHGGSVSGPAARGRAPRGIPVRRPAARSSAWSMGLLAAWRGDQHADGRVPVYLEERGRDIPPARDRAEPLFEVRPVVGVVDEERDRFRPSATAATIPRRSSSGEITSQRVTTTPA